MRPNKSNDLKLNKQNIVKEENKSCFAISLKYFEKGNGLFFFTFLLGKNKRKLKIKIGKCLEGFWVTKIEITISIVQEKKILNAKSNKKRNKYSGRILI